MIKEFVNLYNTLVNLSRNKSLFSIFTDKDTFSDRLLILLFHFAFFLRKYKNNVDNKKQTEILGFYYNLKDNYLKIVTYFNNFELYLSKTTLKSFTKSVINHKF